MSFKAIVTIAELTVHEAARRKVLLAALIGGLGFLTLFGIGFHFASADVMKENLADTIKVRMVLTFFTLAGLYAANFLTVMTAVLLPVDTISGELTSGVIQTIASKPIRRAEIVLGKWLAYVVVTAGYLALLSGGVLLIVRVLAGHTVPNVQIGLPLMLLEGILLVTLSIAGGTRFSTVTNGIVALALYGIAFLGGWVEQIGTMTGNRPSTTIGTIASLIMPSESLWQLAAHNMQPKIMGEIGFTPFSPASVPTAAMVWWAVGYIVVVMALALRGFEKRGL